MQRTGNVRCPVHLLSGLRCLWVSFFCVCLSKLYVVVVSAPIRVVPLDGREKHCYRLCHE